MATIIIGAFFFCCILGIYRGMGVLARSLLFLFFRLFYRIGIEGSENVPREGGVLLAANRLGPVDKLILAFKMKRKIHFFAPPGVNCSRPLKDLLKKGECVCLYPEEAGNAKDIMQNFRKTLQSLKDQASCPLIPLFVDNLWGGLFDERLGSFLLRRFPYPVTILFGRPASAEDAIRDIQNLGYESWMKKKKRPVHHGFIQNARLKPLRKIMCDEKTPKVTYLKTLAGSIALARRLKPFFQDQDAVGILLPQCLGAVLTNAAIAMSGRAAVNLNFSIGLQGILSAISQAHLKTIITSRQFLDKLDLKIPEGVNVCYLEDARKTISLKEKLIALFFALFAPIGVIEKTCGAKRKILSDDTLAIIFTSGSTSEPKGVVLSHANICSNGDAISQVILKDKGALSAVAILPFFHAFGYMLLWLGLNYDLVLILYPNPLDYSKIGDIIERYKARIVISTPSFLRGYLKKVEASKFRHVRCVLTGAEKMPRVLAKAFQEKFGIIPIEGFGTTECSPVVSTNILDCRKASSYPLGFVPGTAGPPLPGVKIKIVDPETGEDVPYGASGLVLVKGPNVMQNYLHRADLTEEAMLGGFYATGDIGFFSSDGYLHVTDRISRFSKIGGEMVPHCKIEEALHKAASIEPQVFAVTSLSDQKKGERLVVFHTYKEGSIKDLIAKLPGQGLPNLFIPKTDQFIAVDKIPVLSSGKLDLRLLKQMAKKQKPVPLSRFS